MTVAAPAAPWQDLAACRGTDTNRFFPISYKGRSAADIDVAVRICRACPVRQPCLAYALSTAQAYGIWGGMTEQQRKLLRRRADRQRRESSRPQPGSACAGRGRPGPQTPDPSAS